MNATNPFLKNRYADLGSIIETARETLKSNGLSYSQLTIGGAEQVGITTILMHTSGEWLESTSTRREELEAYALAPLPTDAGERHLDIEKAIQSADDSGRLLADAEQYLTHAKAQAMFAALKEHDDLTAKERELVIKDAVRQVQRLVDGLTVTSRTIHDRIFAQQNANRSRL